MTGADDRDGLDAAGDRIEGLLGRLAGLPDRRAVEWAEALVRTVSDLYGEALARVIALGCGPDAPAGAAFLARAADDELVGGLLALHGLHPASLIQRVEAALASVPELLGVEDLRVLGADEDASAVSIRMILAPGRGSQRDALEKLVRQTVERAVPDLDRLVVDCPDTGVPVHFRRVDRRVGSGEGLPA